MATADGDASAFLNTLDEKHILPSLSPVVAALLELAANEDCSLGQMADLIQKDPSLTTRILKLANSAFFRSYYPVTTVLHAVSRIGIHHTRLLALTVSLKDALPLKRGGRIDYGRFWRLCLYQGLLARWLAENLQTGDPEEAFTAGFTLEIGLLVLVRAFTHDTRLKIEYPLTSLLAKEKELYGIQHRQIGEALLRSWGFPESFVVCQRSFAFKEDDPPSSEPARLCAIAGELSAFICEPPAFIHDAFDTVETFFGLSTNTIVEAVSTALKEVNDIAQPFEVEVDGAKDAIGLMEKANQTLAGLARGAISSASNKSFPSFDTLPELSRSSDTIAVTMDAVAHEMRNPLTAVGGFARRLAKTIDPMSHEASYVRVIMAETDRLERVLYEMKRMLG